VDSVVQSINFSQSWIIRSRHLPSCCSYKDSIAIAASDPKAPSSCLSQVSIAIYFNDSCIWFAPCLVLRRRIRMLLSVSIPRVGDWTVMLLAGSSYNVVLYASVCFIYDLWILYVLLIESLLVTGKPNSVGDGSYVVEIFFF
jgi:hypothetical protein